MSGEICNSTNCPWLIRISCFTCAFTGRFPCLHLQTYERGFLADHVVSMACACPFPAWPDSKFKVPQASQAVLPCRQHQSSSALAPQRYVICIASLADGKLLLNDKRKGHISREPMPIAPQHLLQLPTRRTALLWDQRFPFRIFNSSFWTCTLNISPEHSS